MTDVLEFDIAIIGGGMVGTSLASLLAASHPQWRIALIEAQSFAQINELHYQPSFDARSTALAYGSADILRELGLWEKLLEHITPIKQVHVSDRGHFMGGLIDAAANKVDAVGYVVQNAWLGNVLLAHVQAQKNIRCFAPAKVTQLIPCAQSSRLILRTPEQEFMLNASLAVIADGGDSPLRNALGIGSQVRSYGQTAIITNVEFSEPHDGVAYERFTSDGPIALLPLGESAAAQESALVWTLPNADAENILQASDEEFLTELQHRFGFRVGHFTRVAKRHAYPLQLMLAEEQIRSHIVLVGNAAHFLHPVAGQGFNLALRDCTCLVEVLREAQDEKKSIGELARLQRYIDRQYVDQQLTVEFSDKLVRLFSNNDLPLIALRHLGFISLEATSFLKTHFTAQTMGTAGRKFRWQFESDTQQKNLADKSPHETSSVQNSLSVNHSSLHTDYDVVIVGAGLVGASLACALASLNNSASLRIAVIEAGALPARYSGKDFDPRVVALTHASQQLLVDIGCWDAITQARVCAYHHMTVWDGEGTAQIDFDGADVRASQLGHIVENSVVVHALRECMAQHACITFIQAAVIDVKQPEPAQPFSRVLLSTGEQLSVSLLIAADGAQSKVRELVNFETREWDYGQQAIITTLRTERSHEFTAWQRFMHTGPLAFLPLQEKDDAHYCSIVWSAEHDFANELMALNDEQFCARIGAAFEYRLGKVMSCAERFAIPLRQRHARTYIQPGIALVGDAAHNIHPLAGQGVNLGLLDVIAMTQEIERALNRGIPLTDYSLLRRYQRARLVSNLGMMSVMEMFKQLFGSRLLSVNWLRNTGMRQLNSLSALKKMIVNKALG